MAAERKASNDASPEQGGDTGNHKHPVSSTMDILPVTGWPTPTSEDFRFRNLYSTSPDFKELARLDPEFAAVVKGRDLDFKDPRAVMQLTKTLLKRDFDLNIDMPDDRLCPPVSNRHNYILWLKGLLDSTSYDAPGRKVVGLDIGTGASCIYPLLGCVQRPWSFIATDIDSKSLEYAKKNVMLNGLESHIRLVARSPESSLLPLDDLGIESIDFAMTNPPFYESKDELARSAAEKSQAPNTACTGAEVEMVTEGGEVAFVERILQESLALRERVQWYTSMLGFLSSAKKLVEKLKEKGIDNYAATEFVQGNKTRRWAVGWSFQAMRPLQSVARGTMAMPAKVLLPPVTEAEVVSMPIPERIGEFADNFSAVIAGLDLTSWEWDKEKFEGVGRAEDNVWNRAWRRRKQREMDTQPDDGGHPTEHTHRALGFKAWVRVGKGQLSVGVRWLEGHDEKTFTSLQGYLKSTALSLAPTKK